MALEGFTPYVPTANDMSLTLTKNGLGINKSTVSKLGCCKYVRIMMDYSGHRMALVETDESDPAKTEFARGEKNSGLRWNSKDLLRTICQMNGWSLDNGEKYIIPGEYSSEDSAMIFDFGQAILSKSV